MNMRRRWMIQIGGREYVVESEGDRIWIDGQVWNGSITEVGKGIYRVSDGEGTSHFVVDRSGRRLEMVTGPISQTVEVQTPIDFLRRSLQTTEKGRSRTVRISAPMPGMVLKVMVQEGAKVEKGTPLVILEAMKMENVLKSDVGGTVSSVHVVAGEAVEKGQLLIVVE